jgi:flagellar L-ring protein precursor FlgH
MRRALALQALLLLLLTASSVCADSLYSPSSFFTDMFADRKAARVGDVLHVLIAENASANQTVGGTHNKQAKVGAEEGSGWLDFIPLLGYGGSSSYSNGSTATRSGSITARLTVTVTEVLASGNLRIEGRRFVQVNRDLQEITIRGQVRPRDIGRDNTVMSYQVADVEILYTGSDPRKPGHSVGFIQRLLNLLF